MFSRLALPRRGFFCWEKAAMVSSSAVSSAGNFLMSGSYSKNLTQIHKKASRSMDAPAIIHSEIGAGELVQADPDARPITGDDIVVLARGHFGEGLGIGENDPTQQSVIGKGKTVFRFQVEHVLTPVTPL